MQCINNMNIDMLDTSTGTAEPPTTCSVAAQQYLLSIYLYYLHLGFGLPGQCQLLVAFWLLWEIKVWPVEPGVSCEVAGDEGQERMAMATQIIVKWKLLGKRKSKWGTRKRKSKWGSQMRKSKSAAIIASHAKGSLSVIQSWLSCTHERHALETVMH